MSEIDNFISDMADSLSEIKATERQREVGKAWLRHAIAYARRKAAERLRSQGATANTSHSDTGETT
jgi:hypothetical protein